MEISLPATEALHSEHAGTTGCILLNVLRKPGVISSLDANEWNILLAQARQTKLLATLHLVLEKSSLLAQLPEAAAETLRWAYRFATAQERAVRWEIRDLQRTLSGFEAPIILLKGAAYIMSGLPPAQGRLVNDIDIMVPKAQLGSAERLLLAAGWEYGKLDAYDQRYYRKWMHELPPLRHRRRQTTLDLHHTILPETSRCRPNATELFRKSVPLQNSHIRILHAADIVLHSAAHLFHDGEMAGSLRDLVDLEGLLRHFEKEPAFFETLAEHARIHGMTRPLHYALRYTEKFLGSPQSIDRTGAPGPITRRIMDAIVKNALLPRNGPHRSAGKATSEFVLYVRSHWLRMPAYLLIPHLVRKSLCRRNNPDK